MIENIQVTSVFANPTKAGKDRWTAETNIGQMQVWDKEVADSLDKHKGKWLEVETAKSADNKFTNLKLVRGIVEQRPMQSQQESLVKFVDANRELNNRHIARQACLKAACVVVPNGSAISLILQMAEQMEAWVYREEEAEQ